MKWFNPILVGDRIRIFANWPTTMPNIKNNFGGLDALRGILSIVVCIAHGWYTFVVPFDTSSDQTIAPALGIAARLAVISFFCLSGYVIAMSIARNTARHIGFNFSDYIISRLFRILPPLLVVMVIVFAASSGAVWFGLDRLPEGIHTVRDTLRVDVCSQLLAIATIALRGDLTGQLDGPLWTLGFEVQLYAIAGLLGVALLSKRSHVAVRIFMSLVSIVFFKRFIPLGHDANMSVSFLWLAFFSFGASSYIWFNHVSRPSLIVVIAIGSIAFMESVIRTPLHIYIGLMDSGVIGVFAQLAYGVASTAGIVFLSRTDTASFLRSLGNFSYTLYILHFPIIVLGFFMVENFAPIGNYSDALSWGSFVVVISIIASQALAKLIEQPAEQRAFFRKLLSSIAGKYQSRFPL